MLTHALSRDGALCCHWTDGAVSQLHNAWLRDHCQQSLHTVSGQRSFELHHLSAHFMPDRVAVSDGGPALALRWPSIALPMSGHQSVASKLAPHTSAFDALWLQAAAGTSFSSITPPLSSAAVDTPWHPSDVRGRVEPTSTWGEVLPDGRSANEAHALRCLRELRSRGFVLVSETPPTEAATQQLASALGRLQGTFYGDGVWDVAPRDELRVIDTAYSNVELPLHVDGTYLQQQPGLQLFVCAEQANTPAGWPAGGSTKLADGFKAARMLRDHHPVSYSYFCNTPLPWRHEGDVHMEHVSTVFDLHPATKHVIGMRYNALDRGPFVAPHMTVHDEVGAFYEHARVLEGILRELELSIRLEPGDALLVDNHRVLHGRHIFAGNRAMVGCYMNRDDWLSRWRMLEARANAGSAGRGNASKG